MYCIFSVVGKVRKPFFTKMCRALIARVSLSLVSVVCSLSMSVSVVSVVCWLSMSVSVVSFVCWLSMSVSAVSVVCWL